VRRSHRVEGHAVVRKTYRTLSKTVQAILAQVPKHIQPKDKYYLFRALKEDRIPNKKRWPSEEECRKLGSGEVANELRRAWPKTNKVLMEAIIEGDW